MNFESVNKIESNFLFVILFPAMIIFVYVLYLLSYVFTQIDIVKLFPFLKSLKTHFFTSRSPHLFYLSLTFVPK